MIPKCLSKILAEQSEEAIRRGEKPTLSERSPCYGCSGTNVNCRDYSNPAVREEDKKSLLRRLIFGERFAERYGLFEGEQNG